MRKSVMACRSVRTVRIVEPLFEDLKDVEEACQQKHQGPNSLWPSVVCSSLPVASYCRVDAHDRVHLRVGSGFDLGLEGLEEGIGVPGPMGL